MTVTVAPKPPTAPSLPNPTDGAAIASYITSVAAFLFGVLGEFHIGVSASFPKVVQEMALPLGTFIAAAIQAINIITHRSAHKAAVLTGVELTSTGNYVHPPGA